MDLHKTGLDANTKLLVFFFHLRMAFASRPPLQVPAPRRRTNFQTNTSRYDKTKHVRLQTYIDSSKAERDSFCCSQDGMER